ncbi:MAG: 2-oxo-4-hydroxy-4-carboxy-5-ureidoimidazoline decarboxylase [Terriglobales bacterium]
MNDVLERWNFLSPAAAVDEILPCCGSRAWASAIVSGRPWPDEGKLLAASDEIWRILAVSDWLEAFCSHPRIGESSVRELREPTAASEKSAAWSQQEQRNVAEAGDAVKIELAEGNREYEQRFKRTFIVCATGKTPEQILQILRRRLNNDEQSDLQEAADEQRQITQTRLRKWLNI